MESLIKGVDCFHFAPRLGVSYSFFALNTLRYPEYTTSLQIVNF